MKSLLSARNIVKKFSEPLEITILNGISLELFQGESLAITGKSGEGKTTLLHILGSLEKPTSGHVTLCGLEVSPATASTIRSQHVGFIFQAYNLLENFTVLENVLLPAKIARKQTHAGSAAEAQALELLKEVDLIQRAHFPAKFLSGGEKQRAAIARALCNDPEILLADEPSGSLDHSHSIAIHELLLSLSEKRNKALVIVTHDPDLASLCKRKQNLIDGKLL